MPRWLILAVGATIVIAGIGGGIALREFTASGARAAAKAPITFALTDQSGKAVTAASYRGKYLLVFFGFTRCPDVCPTTMAKAADMLKELGALADKLQVLFITVDPARDTATILEDYLFYFDRRLVGLTGSNAQIAAVAKTFGVHYAQYLTGYEDNDGSPDYAVEHSNAVYVVDDAGVLLRAYLVEDANLRADLRAALEKIK